jgi:hypothetical protein
MALCWSTVKQNALYMKLKYDFMHAINNALSYQELVQNKNKHTNLYLKYFSILISISYSRRKDTLKLRFVSNFSNFINLKCASNTYPRKNVLAIKCVV